MYTHLWFIISRYFSLFYNLSKIFLLFFAMEWMEWWDIVRDERHVSNKIAIEGPSANVILWCGMHKSLKSLICRCIGRRLLFWDSTTNTALTKDKKRKRISRRKLVWLLVIDVYNNIMKRVRKKERDCNDM